MYHTADGIVLALTRHCDGPQGRIAHIYARAELEHPHALLPARYGGGQATSNFESHACRLFRRPLDWQWIIQERRNSVPDEWSNGGLILDEHLSEQLVVLR